MVNPFDIEEVADGINMALKMGKRERSVKIALLQKLIKENDIYNWSRRIINYLD
jgi:trehalose-6-phosphate synthase